MALLWEYNGYVFPADSQPRRGGAGEWNRKRKAVIHEPINSTIDVITNLGFNSGRRTIRGRCSQAFRDQIRTFFGALTVGDLIDADGQTQSAQILEQDFQQMLPTHRYEYSITFIAR